MGCCCASEMLNLEETRRRIIASSSVLLKQVCESKDMEDEADVRIFVATWYRALQEGLACETVTEAKDKAAACVAKSNSPAAQRAWRQFFDIEEEEKKNRFDINEIYTNDTKANIIQNWCRFDSDASGALNKNELKELVEACNLPDTLCKNLFAETKKLSSSEVSFNDFSRIYKNLLTPSELYHFWKHANHAAPGNELAFFFKDVQKMSQEEADKEVVGLKKRLAGTEEIDQALFFDILCDRTLNGVIDAKSKHTISQDMTKPLKDYFINSSHNTYLSGDQLHEDSKVEMYTQALLDGCRCVELDCWDGKGEDDCVIYHGYTLTSKIKFEDVIDAIKKDAFTNSDYPVTLSLELHVSVPTQKRMAKIMKEKFGNTLAAPTWNTDEEAKPAVTPEGYKRKIILKAKRLKGNKQSAEEKEQDDFDADDDPEDKVKEIEENKKKTEADQKKQGLAQELSDLIIMNSKHFIDFDKPPKIQPHEVCSLGESKATKLATASEADIEAFRQYNKKRLTRIYPAGYRVDSSNFNPQIFWNSGCQLVALNFQKRDQYEFRFYKSRFRAENGGCGYILKPGYMREPGQEMPQTALATSLKVDIISGVALPKQFNATRGECVDPYVYMFLEGQDVSKTKLKHKTSSIENNGFHPVWAGKENSSVTFQVKVPELATLVVQVYDKDPAMNGDDLLGETFLPVHLIRPGMRSIGLCSGQTTKPLASSFLLANFTITNSSTEPTSS